MSDEVAALKPLTKVHHAFIQQLMAKHAMQETEAAQAFSVCVDKYGHEYDGVSMAAGAHWQRARCASQ